MPASRQPRATAARASPGASLLEIESTLNRDEKGGPKREGSYEDMLMHIYHNKLRIGLGT